MSANGWYVRTGGGGPGIAGATWSAAHVTFLTDPAAGSNRLMRLSAQTSGPGSQTIQSQVTRDDNYLEGTYAARVFFTDAPVSGPDGDQIVETFYTITPLNFSMDPAYSEIDFEYLANGGWGFVGSTMFMTTWETYQPDPWISDNTYTAPQGNFSGWHNLVVTVSGGVVRYYIDGTLRAEHGGKYYPETRMSINFNLWFIELIANATSRTYRQDVDWVYFRQNTVLTPAQVQAEVNALRSQGVAFRDTVP
jgi:hypothetical protein